MSQRSLRQRPRISYFEPEEPSLDEYVFCEKCADYVYEYCSIHGPLLVIPDDKVPAKPNFPSYVPRAALTIPHVFLHLNYSTIPGAGLGVFTTLTLPCGVRFGPYRGRRTSDVTSDYSWQIYDRNNKPSHVVDAADGNNSNWMRYVNCARHWVEQNLVAFQYRGELYYRTIRIIPRFTELMVFYGSEFANILHVDLGKYNSPKSYAQKFGAPAPKKPKFGVESKKLQQRVVLKPLEGNKENNQSKTSNSTATPNTSEQAPLKSIKKCAENKTQSGKGTLAPKKRSIEAVDKRTPATKKWKTQTVGKTSQPTDSITKHIKENTSDLDNNRLPCENISTNGLCKKRKTQKIETKPNLPREALKSTEKEKHVGNKLSINSTSTENHTNNNTDVDDRDLSLNKNTTIKNSFDKENKSFNNERDKLCQIQSKDQNVKQIQIQDAYYCCDVCQYQGVTKGSLEKHMRRHDINLTFVCETCSYRFSTSFTLNNHKLKRHGMKTSAIKILECNICDYTTVIKAHLKNHLFKHAGLKPYSCNTCDYKFSQAGNLKTHLRTHTGEKPYSCNTCDYKCSKAGTLKTHLRTHTREKPYSCNTCDYKCAQAGTLKTHLRTHTGEKPYSCNTCDYKCSEAGNLKTHLRTHTGEKPYSCNTCDYKCSKAGTLKTHLRTHTREKPYSCNTCDYKCAQAGTLKTHLRTHTGEKRYSCNTVTIHASALKTHLKTHRG